VVLVVVQATLVAVAVLELLIKVMQVVLVQGLMFKVVVVVLVELAVPTQVA
jgi:hypothetical protein